MRLPQPWCACIHTVSNTHAHQHASLYRTVQPFYIFASNDNCTLVSCIYIYIFLHIMMSTIFFGDFRFYPLSQDLVTHTHPVSYLYQCAPSFLCGHPCHLISPLGSPYRFTSLFSVLFFPSPWSIVPTSQRRLINYAWMDLDWGVGGDGGALRKRPDTRIITYAQCFWSFINLYLVRLRHSLQKSFGVLIHLFIYIESRSCCRLYLPTSSTQTHLSISWF